MEHQHEVYLQMAFVYTIYFYYCIVYDLVGRVCVCVDIAPNFTLFLMVHLI